MKQILFSRTFPVGHPRAGEPTYFIEKVWESLCLQGLDDFDYQEYINKFPEGQTTFAVTRDLVWPKNHTIRAGHRWKEGEWFAPKVWSEKPYRSKCIQFAPPIQIKKIWDIDIDINGVVSLNGFYSEDVEITAKLALNDGLSEWDFQNWFSDLPFAGQVICWNEHIQYS